MDPALFTKSPTKGTFFLKPPLYKGRWHGAAVTEGLYTAEQSPCLRVCGDIPLYTRGTFFLKPPLYKGRWCGKAAPEGL